MSKKRFAIVCTSIALSAAVAIGGTLAYLTATPPKATNTFTLGQNLTGTLTEPNWESTGKTLATHIVPNLSIPKDPTVTNTSKDQNAYVAVKLDCKTFMLNEKNEETTLLDGLAGYNAIFGDSGFATMGDLSTEWAQSTTDPTVFYYKNVLAYNNASTPPVFQHVNIKEGATYEQLNSFKIDVTAYLVQSDTFNTNSDQLVNAKNALHTGFNTIPAA